jgi:PilZ domain
MLYMGKDFAGQGAIRELSTVGCRILGNYPVTRGETLSLRISHPTHPDPLLIKQVGVRWVKGFEFGVSFGPLDEAVADRLHCLLDDVLDSGSYSECPSPS